MKYNEVFICPRSATPRSQHLCRITMLPLLLLFLLQGLSAQTIYTDPALDPNILGPFPSQTCVRYALTTGIAFHFPACNSSVANWACICSTTYAPVLSSLVGIDCVTQDQEYAGEAAVATTAFAAFCQQLTATSSRTTSLLL